MIPWRRKKNKRILRSCLEMIAIAEGYGYSAVTYELSGTTMRHTATGKEVFIPMTSESMRPPVRYTQKKWVELIDELRRGADDRG